MESDSLLNDEHSYGTSSGLGKTISTSSNGSSNVSLNSIVSNNHASNHSFLLPPINQSLRSESFMSIASLSRSIGNRNNDDQNLMNVDEHRVSIAAQEAGRHAFGVVAVDVWTLDHGRFVHVPGGTWVNPVFAKRHPSDALDRILNPDHPQYAPPLPQVPGAGLAGYFWALGSDSLVWRDLHAITSDPFQPPYQRMHVLQEAGFGKATGIRFDIMGHQGVVIYLCRETASEPLLNQATNAQYLRIAAQHVGTASALSRPRQESCNARNSRISKRYRSFATKIHCINSFSSLRQSLSSRSLSGLARVSRSNSVHEMVEDQMNTAKRGLKNWTNRLRSEARKRFTSLVEKCQGSNLKPPPPVPFLNAAWTFVGAFITLLALYGVSFLIGYETGETLVLAPFGALMALQFSLTAAPASQPRSVVYGQLICIFMALLAKYYLIEHANWPLWTVVPLTTAGGIAMMTKLSVTHPPAAASVVALFSMPNFTVLTGAIILAGNMLAIIMAMLINNLSEKRQYPVYWEFGFVSTQESRGEQLRPLVLQRQAIQRTRSGQEFGTTESSPEVSDRRSNVEPLFHEHSNDPTDIPVGNFNASGHPSDLESQQARRSDLRLVDDEAMIYFSY